MISINKYFEAAVNNKYPPTEDYTPSNNISTRVTQLGLSNIDGEKSAVSQFKELEEKTWSLAPTVKKPLLFYDTEDYSKAINFLEVWTMYSAGFHTLTTGSDNLKNNSKYIQKDDKLYYDKTVVKLIKELEDLNKIVLGSPVSPTELKAKVKMIKRHVDKVFSENLSKTEKIAFGDVIETAKAILSNLA